MLSNAYFLAKFRFDTAENEPAKNLQIFEKCIFKKCIFEKCIFEADRGRGSSAAGAVSSPGLSSGAGGDVRERRLAKFRQNVARFRLYRLRFLQENMRFAAFFKIYQIFKLKFLTLNFGNILQILRHLRIVC